MNSIEDSSTISLFNKKYIKRVILIFVCSLWILTCIFTQNLDLKCHSLISVHDDISQFLNHFLLLFIKLNLKLLVLITKQKASATKEPSIKELLMACYSINRKTKSYIISEFTSKSLALRRRRYRSTWDLYRCAVIASWKLNPIPPNIGVKYLRYLEFLQTLLERVIIIEKKSKS